MPFSSFVSAVALFLRDESGVVQVEYALITALLSVCTVTALHSHGQALVGLFDLVGEETEPVAKPWSGG